KLRAVSYDEMLEMAASGAKVLQLRSVEFARNHDVRLHVRSTFADAEGTWITKEDDPMLEKAMISGVVHTREELVYRVAGAVGGVLRELLRDWDDVHYFASARSAGSELDGRRVEEATPEALESGGLDLCFSAVGATASLELVPHAVRGGAVAIDKSSAWRM